MNTNQYIRQNQEITNNSPKIASNQLDLNCRSMTLLQKRSLLNNAEQKSSSQKRSVSRLDSSGSGLKNWNNANSVSSNFGLIQRAFTRSMLQLWVDNFTGSEAIDWLKFSSLPDIDRYMVLNAVGANSFVKKGGSIHGACQFLGKMDSVAEEDSDVDHYGGGAEEITKDNPRYGDLLQMKRGPGPSGPKDVPDAGMEQVTYKRDIYGNVNFQSPEVGYKKWSDPVNGAPINLAEDSKNPKFGMTLNGSFVDIANASREQHFSIANRVAKKKGAVAGNGGSSPDGLTWHHLKQEYNMVLVKREAHQKFGHNGGFYFWN